MSKVTYEQVRIADLKLTQGQRRADGKYNDTLVEVGNVCQAVATPRFWTSAQRRLGISPSIFRLFSPEEVFSRCTEVDGGKEFTAAIERREGGLPRLLGLSLKDAIHVEDAERIIRQNGGDPVYSDGKVVSTITPRSGNRAFTIGGDTFKNRYQIEIPVDGLGSAQTFLGMIRLICSNGMVGMTPAFRTIIASSADQQAFTIDRFLGTFDNATGYDVIQSRLRQSQVSWASFREVHKLKTLLASIGAANDISLAAVNRVAGTSAEMFGVFSGGDISNRRMALLPSKATVYDLINIATEVSSHHTKDEVQRGRIHAWVGETLAAEYDLEGTKQVTTDFADFLIDTSKAVSGQ